MSTSKGYFDRIGADWDGMQESFFSERVRTRAFEVAEIVSGRRAVDLGAGTGFVTGGLLERGLHVIAVDQSAVMLKALRAKFPETAALDCRSGDAEKIPVDDACVDYCFANMLLHHVDNPQQAIQEMARIVRPGGRVVVTDLDAHDHQFLREEHHDRWMGFPRKDIQQWFREAGLMDVQVESVGETCCATSCAGESAAVSIFLGIGTVPGSILDEPC